MRRTLLPILLIALASTAAQAQQSGAAAALNEQQELGRKLTSQSCVVCHFPLQRGVHIYGPKLTRESLSGDAEAMKTVIANGTPRMPGFKHMFDTASIEAVVAYIKTIPAPPSAARAPATQGRPNAAGAAQSSED